MFLLCRIFLLSVLLYPLLTPAFSLFQKRADVEKILSPSAGERMLTGIDKEIRWVSNSSSDANVTIELRKGWPQNITVVHTIASDTPNNGSYMWRSRDDPFLEAHEADELPQAPHSGCDYKISFRDGSANPTFSDYFAIVNLFDDGLPSDAVCPDNKNSTTATTTGNTSADDGGEDLTQTHGNATRGIANTDDDTTSGGDVTRAMLAGAVAGTAVGLLLIFAATLFVAKKLGWFTDREYVRQQIKIAMAEIEGKPVIASGRVIIPGGGPQGRHLRPTELPATDFSDTVKRDAHTSPISPP